jgi:DNA polymerase
MSPAAALTWLAERGITLAADGPDLSWEAATDLPSQQVDQLEAYLKVHKLALLHQLSRVRLDFETAGALDLKEVGVYRYLSHLETKILSLVWCIGPGKIQVWQPGEPPPLPLLQAADNCSAFFVSHGLFDFMVWHCLLIPQGWPKVPLARWSDTMARCRVYRAPASLEKAALRLGLGVEKDPRGKRLILKAHLHARGEGPPLTDQEMQEFDSYARTDASVLRELDRFLPELPTLERGAYGLDVSMNDRGLPFDLDLVRNLIPVYDAENVRLDAQMQSLCGLRAAQVAALVEWLKTNAANPPANMQTQTLKDWLSAGASPPSSSSPVRADIIRQVVETRLEFANNSGTKLNTILAWALPDGRVRGAYQAHGAHTGRWSSHGPQVQNFPKWRGPGNFDFDATIAGLLRPGGPAPSALSVKKRIALCLRGLVKAPEGFMLVVVDLAQVEGRTLAWLAGQRDLLDRFRRYDSGDRSSDPYLHAAAALGQPGYRDLGKLLTLSAGFGIGALGLVKRAPHYGVVLTEAEAERNVAAWRAANPMIVAFWYALFSAVREVASEPVGSSVETYGLWVSHEDGVNGCDLLRIVLPSGRSLIYHQPGFKPDEEHDWKFNLHYRQAGPGDWIEKKPWHGLVTENIVQAIALDLLVHDMQQIETAGIPIIGCTHHEVVALVPEKDARAALDRMLDIMKTPPDWAKDLPLAAEGYYNHRYVKKPSGGVAGGEHDAAELA